MPVSETISGVHNTDAFVRVIVGPIGSGKTLACLVELLNWSFTMPPDARGRRRSRFLIARRTLKRPEETLLKDWKGLLDRLGGLGTVKHSSPLTWSAEFSPGDGTIVETEFLFSGFDQPDSETQLLGQNLTGILVDELAEFERRKVFDAALERVGRYPERVDVPEYRQGVRISTNPTDRDHWLARILLDNLPITGTSPCSRRRCSSRTAPGD